MPELEGSSIDRTGVVSSQFPQTLISLQYQNLLKVPEISSANINQLAAGGIYMPQTNLPNLTDYFKRV